MSFTLKTMCKRIDTIVKREENRWKTLALTAIFTCSRSKSIMQIAQSQESMRKSREGVDSSVARARNSRCDATSKTRRVNRCSVSASGKRAVSRRCSRFSDCLSSSFVTCLFISLYGETGFITAADRIVNVRYKRPCEMPQLSQCVISLLCPHEIPVETPTTVMDIVIVAYVIVHR